MRRVVVLRPEPGAAITVAKARQRGLDAVALSLFMVAPVSWSVSDAGDFDALLLTSANAVRHGGEGLAGLRKLPVHVVGDATAEAASAAGLLVASAGDSGVDALLSSMKPGLKLLHLCGENRKIPVNASHDILSIVVYRSDERPVSDLDAATGSLALVHSPRAGARFAQLCDEARLDRGAIAVVAISAAAGDAVGDGWEAIAVAERPSDDALLALAERLCNKPAP
ncbi:MAG: uroporphyrinogen-III synthase [Sphingomicrobium sp.]